MKVKGKGYDIKAAGDQKTAEIMIYSDIGTSFFGDSVDAKTFGEDLNALPDSIETISLRLNSPGGSVFEGMAIYNSLLKHSARVEVSIDGMAFSIASVIAMAGDSITIAEGAMMMIHNPWTVVGGDSKELRKVAEMMDKSKEGLIKAYQRHVSDGEKAISSMMDAETWFTAQEAVDAGFATEIFEAAKIAACYKGAGVEAHGFKKPVPATVAKAEDKKDGVIDLPEDGKVVNVNLKMNGETISSQQVIVTATEKKLPKEDNAVLINLYEKRKNLIDLQR